MNVVSEQRKRSAAKHAQRIYTCACGKQVRGNGARASHRKACQVVARTSTTTRGRNG